jgi:ribonuclease P protein subunit RPR2
MPLLPGVDCSVRLRNRKITMKCFRCGSFKRMPYLEEQGK